MDHIVEDQNANDPSHVRIEDPQRRDWPDTTTPKDSPPTAWQTQRLKASHPSIYHLNYVV
jgi:hypothetical protein